jgi:Uma2 family endonuclease
MSIVQADIQLLRQAIRQLSRREREELAEWILNSPDSELGVAESRASYGEKHHFTVDEFLRFEEEKPGRYEYVAGRIFEMTPELVRHQMIVTNVAAAFQTQLRGTPCWSFASNMKLRLKAGEDEIVYLPDVMIACGPFTEEALDASWLKDPCVLVEVISASTESIDRREKALNYRHIASLEEYLVITQRSMEVTLFRRTDNWRPLVLTTPEDVFESRAVEVHVTLANIYEGVR